MILFPAIDLKEGLAVRLQQGDMARATVFHRDPAAQAQVFESQGFKHLHVVDLDGAFAGKPMNVTAVERISGNGRAVRAARRRHPRHGDGRGLARQGRQPRDHRHRGSARSGAGQGRPRGISRSKSPSGSTRATARWRCRAGRRPPELDGPRHRAPLRGRRRRRHRLYRHDARRHAEGLQPRRHGRAGRGDFYPGDRRRAAWPRSTTSRRCSSRVRASCKARSPAARSMTGGSTRPRRLN